MYIIFMYNFFLFHVLNINSGVSTLIIDLSFYRA